MKDLKNFLEHLTQSLDKDVRIKKTAVQCIKDYAGFKIAPENISVKGAELVIKTSPVRKSVLNLNQKEILEHINEAAKLNLKNIFYI